MPSVTKLINEYLNNSQINSLNNENSYKTNENTQSQLSIETKNKIIGNFYQYDILSLIVNTFGVLQQNVIIISSGTQGFVIKFNSNNLHSGINLLKNNYIRSRGPYFEDDLKQINKIAVKIQIIDSESRFYEKRTMREE